MKVVKIVGIIILVILPYSTILSNFSPYWTDHSFQTFLLASFVFAIVSLLLGWWISNGKLFKSDGFPFFLLGLFTSPPLLLGPPEISPKLLERASEEQFRYGMLFLATLAFAFGFYTILKKYYKTLVPVNKLIVIPFVISEVLLIWDNYSSFNLSVELKNWIADGKSAEDFFLSYNFHETYRAFGRTLAYVLVIWLGFILLKKQEMRKWQMWTLGIFSLIGILFFFLFLSKGFDFYFPFMVPAIAFAPVYWLGLTRLSVPK